MESRFGKKSVLYISFGTLFVPSQRPQLFDALIKTILAAEPPLPFVFAGAKSTGILSEEAKKAIERCGRGLLADFVPQQALLKHDATGFYLCHAGSNSISEAFLNGVSMILWPYSIDQPLIANQVSVGLGLAFELVQVRNGESIGKPTHRGPIVEGTQEAVEAEMTDVWAKMRGEEGQKMRERVVKFGNAMKEDYKDGKARQAMNRVSEFFEK
ncbi:glycosyltransferase family 1 protein [Collybiopsis luxurians FD-317 M1]|uniref:Glycosyltransferase family 1 protein n=1 Tax=Collybiopsis luxurians FD-317 M1 TaxID=944289 RepID=A0A0D0ATQ0_9AGAR|nr:glycosyltransferase family 1 protein [Collybiopsis luxurians FD-317 M1]